MAGLGVVYDVGANEAWFGEAQVAGHALVWQLGGDGNGAKLSADLDVDPGLAWVLRCDRVDVPPRGVAYLHTHPGGGIRCMIKGALEVEAHGDLTFYKPFEAWFENGSDPVRAFASQTAETAFVRVMLLPREWEGKRTIRYVNPEDADKPKLQVATLFFDQRIEL